MCRTQELAIKASKYRSWLKILFIFLTTLKWHFLFIILQEIRIPGPLSNNREYIKTRIFHTLPKTTKFGWNIKSFTKKLLYFRYIKTLFIWKHFILLNTSHPLKAKNRQVKVCEKGNCPSHYMCPSFCVLLHLECHYYILSELHIWQYHCVYMIYQCIW